MSFYDILDEGGTVALFLDRRYPLQELEQICQNLAEVTYLVPGFIPAEAGFLNLHTLILDQFSEEIDTLILPDRNVVTRMAQIAQYGIREDPNGQQLRAANLMALAHIVDWKIEPSIAFHELAHRTDNLKAADELSWFRAADNAQAWGWINIALGRTRKLRGCQPVRGADLNLARPLKRWQVNYIICLKIAELELTNLEPLARATTLMQWMDVDFFFNGPAALFSIAYFGPRSERSGMMKSLRSKDRDRAIAGIKNAAWDITYLGDFARRAKESNFPTEQYILATADKSLAVIAQLLFPRHDLSSAVDEFSAVFCRWWPDAEAVHLAHALVDCFVKVGQRNGLGSKEKLFSLMPKMAKDGETRMLAWPI